jgi:hypothetical protein
MTKLAVQQTFLKDVKLKKPYSYGPYNVIRRDEQRIRITEGCVNNCSQCNEPTEIKIFGIPKIERNKVSISDMNLLCKPESLQIIKDLGAIRVNGKVVEYELICGIDYRFLTQEIADELHLNRFRKIRLAWDGSVTFQKRIKQAVKMLLKAGYRKTDLMIFFIANYTIPLKDCLFKLDLCKIWGVQACDCYFDGEVMPHVIPRYWTWTEIVECRNKTRKHNLMVNFEVDPEL